MVTALLWSLIASGAAAQSGPARWITGKEIDAINGYWVYADTTNRVSAFVSKIVRDHGVCDASALVAVGLASADNKSGKHETHSSQRADRLAALLRESCGRTPIWKASLGGYSPEPDDPTQRPFIVIRINWTDGPVTKAVVERLLCHRDAHPNLGLDRFGRSVLVANFAAYRTNVCQNPEGWDWRLSQ